MNIDNLLTVQDVANKLKVTNQNVRKLINDGKLESTRIGNLWVFKPEYVENYIKKYNVCIEPNDHERLSNEIPKIVALSFFSGAMGLDIGFRNMGIEPVLACEFNKYCRSTIFENNKNIALIGDINKYTADDILKMAKIPKNHKIDIVFGGPPCQAFSTAGAGKSFDDERGNVFLKFIDLIGELKPTYFVIENVRGLLSAQYPCLNIKEPLKGGAFYIIMDKLTKLGYKISFELYNSANFGAPQIRERVVIIAKLGNKKVPYLSPTNSEKGLFGLPLWKTLREALKDVDPSKCNYIVFPEKRLKYYRILKEGQYWKNLPLELQKEAMGASFYLSGGKTGFFRRLSYDKPSPTLVTNPTMPATDLCHPTEDRPLSVEEYIAIQGFPKDWKICGPILEQYRQIGNAVPIKLGEAIARTIIADINGEKLPSYPNFPYSRYKNTNDISWNFEMKKTLQKYQKVDEQILFQL